MKESELKTAFAAELIRYPGDPFKAALAVFGTDTGKALRAAHEWFKDSFVIKEIERLKAEGFETYDKEELRNKLIANLLQIVENERSTPDDRIKAAKVIGEIRGLIEKPQVSINNSIVSSNKIMIVKDHGDNESWENRLREQQRVLTSASATSR